MHDYIYDTIASQTQLLETIHPYPEPPWTEPKWTVENVGCTRDEAKKQVLSQIAEETAQGACVIFTDGSYIPDVGGGAAIATKGKVAGHAYGPIEGISNYEMEAMALMIALVQFKYFTDDPSNTFRSLAIFSDSQAALNLLANPVKPQSLQYLARFLLRSHRKIPVHLAMKLYWTPGHEGIELNEQADEAAKQAAESDEQPMILPMSLGGLLRHTRSIFRNRGAVSIAPYKTKAKKIADALQSLEKGDAAAIFQLQCGHCPLKKFLHRIGVEEDNKCEDCKATETPAHFLIYCKKYTKQQQVFRRTLKEEGIKINVNSAFTLLDSPRVYPHLAEFLRATGRFTHLKSYLDK